MPLWPNKLLEGDEAEVDGPSAGPALHGLLYFIGSGELDQVVAGHLGLIPTWVKV